MTTPFIGQIQPFAFNFAPKGWAFCNGQLLPITQNVALFSLLGTYYGGNGQTTFALPDLRSRVPLSFGVNNGEQFAIGEQAGEESVVLQQSQMPLHTHAFVGATANANSGEVEGVVLAKSTDIGSGTAVSVYGSDATTLALNAGSLSAQGQNLAHDNIQPYLAINWCIALVGLFPSRS
jgi:microcystin-dependent protein